MARLGAVNEEDGSLGWYIAWGSCHAWCNFEAWVFDKSIWCGMTAPAPLHDLVVTFFEQLYSMVAVHCGA